MALIAVVSAGGAAGVTTTALALSLSWPSPSLLVEASPAGGQVQAGYLGGSVPIESGLWELALATRHGLDASAMNIRSFLTSLDADGYRLLLAGLRNPFWAQELAGGGWEQIAEVLLRTERLAGLAHDVIVDLGPVDPDLPFALANAADVVMVVMRPTLTQVWAARPRLEALRLALGDTAVLGLCVVGDEGPYDDRDIVEAVGPFHFTVRLPADTKSARVLSHGDTPRGVFGSRPLMREARLVASTLSRLVQEVAATPPDSLPVGPPASRAELPRPVEVPMGRAR